MGSEAEVWDAINHSRRVVIDFAKRNGCVPCRRLAPHYEAAAARMTDVLFATVHLDELKAEDFTHLVDAFALQATPTVVLSIEGDAGTLLHERTAPLLIKEIEGVLHG